MSGWMPADSGAARLVTEAVLHRAARKGNFDSGDVEEIADAWMDYGNDRYSGGAANEREINSCT
jgi:hypothetical protein